MQPSNPYSVTVQNELGGELWKLPLEPKGAEVVLRDRDGHPFEVKHAYGKGQVYSFESAVTLAYLRRKMLKCIDGSSSRPCGKQLKCRSS